MQNDLSSTWPAGVPTTGDDLSNFLEFNDLDIDFPAFDGQAQSQNAQPQETPDQDGMKQGYDAAAYYEQMRQAAMHRTGSTGDLRGRMNGLQVRPSSHPAQHGYPQQMYAHGRIPPTPSSTDMHGAHPQLVVEAHQAAMYEAQMRKQQEQMAFTPLGTPAVTPMDTHFQMREYAVPGEYFSPLASPAMHAQNHHSDATMYYPYGVSDISETTSPVDMSFDSSLKPAVTKGRPQKRRSPGSTSKPSTRTVRQSPAMKAQKKKASSTIIAAKDIQDVLASSRPGTANGSLGPPAMANNMSSESPEPLSDIMPPPALPNSTRSPFIVPGSQSAPVTAQAPATPTSLFQTNTAPMADLNLGDAAMGNNEDVTMNDASTPAITPVESAAKVSSVSTPAMSPPSTGPVAKSKAKEFKQPAKGKKRNSSTQPSPALRPKASPSIKPLLPGGINPQASALLLASKSNYQNILDGTHLPGVVYPEALSENLTSKRTSHKIAEQGRRNRINTALADLGQIMPPTTSANGSDSPQSTASKARTVERAVAYIESLHEAARKQDERIAELLAQLAKENTSESEGVITNEETPAKDSDSAVPETGSKDTVDA